MSNRWVQAVLFIGLSTLLGACEDEHEGHVEDGGMDAMGADAGMDSGGMMDTGTMMDTSMMDTK
jgi:hypothetical protein